MQIWVITEDVYADERIVGVATSEEQAIELKKRAVEYREADDRAYPDEVQMYGPYAPGQLYDWQGKTI